MTTTGELADWWRELSVAAVVGTGRRSVPTGSPLPVADDPETRAEVRLLDALAVGAAARAAGRRPQRASERRASAVAPPDERAVAPAQAVQLLELALVQPPGGLRYQDALLTHWLTIAEDRRMRAPHALMPALLEHAKTDPRQRAMVRPVLDHCGRWLVAHRADWSWATERPEADEHGGPVDPQVCCPGCGRTGGSLRRLRASGALLRRPGRSPLRGPRCPHLLR